VLNKAKGTLCEGVGIHRTIMLKEHTLTLSCIVTIGTTEMDAVETKAFFAENLS